MNTNNFITARNQEDIVRQRLGHLGDPLQQTESTNIPVGLEKVLNEAPINELYLSTIMYNALRSYPIVQKFSLKFGEFDPTKTKTETKTIKKLITRSKSEISDGLANLVCTDDAVVYVSLDVEGVIVTEKLLKGTRYDEENLELVDPKFIVSYLRQR